MNGPSLPGPFLTRALSLTRPSSSPGPLLAKTFFPLAPSSPGLLSPWSHSLPRRLLARPPPLDEGPFLTESLSPPNPFFTEVFFSPGPLRGTPFSSGLPLTEAFSLTGAPALSKSLSTELPFAKTLSSPGLLSTKAPSLSNFTSPPPLLGPLFTRAPSSPSLPSPGFPPYRSGAPLCRGPLLPDRPLLPKALVRRRHPFLPNPLLTELSLNDPSLSPKPSFSTGPPSPRVSLSPKALSPR